MPFDLFWAPHVKTYVHAHFPTPGKGQLERERESDRERQRCVEESMTCLPPAYTNINQTFNTNIIHVNAHLPVTWLRQISAPYAPACYAT